MHAPVHPPAATPIPPEVLLLAYRSGVFPMAESREDDEVFWVEPKRRAIIPLDGFRCSRSLAKVLRADRYQVSMNGAFDAVLEACAAPRPEADGGESGTWISHQIAASYRQLHRQGHAHSVECRLDGELIGGLYGVAFDSIFCGESMFARADNASKVALAWLVALMRRAGYVLLDCQFITPHLASMGAVEIARADYLARLEAARKVRRRLTLPQALAELYSAAAGSGVAVAAGDGAALGDAAGAGRADPPLALGAGSGASSPGKLIAQSFSQTS